MSNLCCLPGRAGGSPGYARALLQRPGHWASAAKRGMIVDRALSVGPNRIGRRWPVSYLLAKEAADQFDSRARRTAALVDLAHIGNADAAAAQQIFFQLVDRTHAE